MLVYKDGRPIKEGDIIDMGTSICFWKIYHERYDRPDNSDVNRHLKDEYKELIAVAPRPQYLPHKGDVVFGGGIPWIIQEVIHDLDENEYHMIVSTYPKERMQQHGSNAWREPVTFLFDMKEKSEVEKNV